MAIWFDFSYDNQMGGNGYRLKTRKSLCVYWPNQPRTLDQAQFHHRENFRDVEKASKFKELELGAVSVSRNVTAYNQCSACPPQNFCRSIRISLDKFFLSDSQKRKLSRFSDIVSIQERPVSFDREEFELLKRYVESKHGDTATQMKNFTAEEYKEMLGNCARLATAYDRESKSSIAVAYLDQHDNQFSLEYVCYDPKYFKASPGIGMTLIVTQTLQRFFPEGVLYLGSWSPLSPKLGYKNQFHGLQVFSGGQWVDVERNISAENAPSPDRYGLQP